MPKAPSFSSISRFGLPAPVMAMSKPLSARNTVTRAGFHRDSTTFAIAVNAGIFATIAGARTGHSVIATISSEWRAWKPKTVPLAVRMAEKIARRRLPGAIGTIGSTAASIPRCANAATTWSRFHAR